MSSRLLTTALPCWTTTFSRLVPHRHVSSVTSAIVRNKPSTDWSESARVAGQELCRSSDRRQLGTPTAPAHHGHFSNSLHQRASDTTTTAVDQETESNGSSSSSSDDGGPEFDSVDTIRRAVLDASLPFILEYGLTEEAIARGAESIGYSRMTHGVVTGGGAELFVHLQDRLNDQLQQHLQQQQQHLQQQQQHLQQQQQQHSDASFASQVEAGLRARLALLLPYSSVWPHGLALVALSPSNLQQHLHGLAVLADHVTHYAGDTSTDSRWYWRRAAVLAVYKSSELCLLQDKSPQHQDTWQFLQRRCSELQAGCDLAGSLDTVVTDAAHLTKAALHTGLNMLGLNSRF